MSPSPDDRLASLVTRSSIHGWLPADDEHAADHDLDADHDDEAEQPRNRPVPASRAIIALIVLVLAGVLVFVLLSPLGDPSPPGPDEVLTGAESAEALVVEAPDPGSTVLTVHVVGEVQTPAVVELPPGARVSDAVDAAGGPTPQADTSLINLARPLVDGEQVIVPSRQEPVEQAAGGAPQAGPQPDAGTDGRPGTADSRINLNTADAGELEQLPGVGPATSAAIIEHRARSGPFVQVEQLLDVPGIGPATLERLRELVMV